MKFLQATNQWMCTPKMLTVLAFAFVAVASLVRILPDASMIINIINGLCVLFWTWTLVSVCRIPVDLWPEWGEK